MRRQLNYCQSKPSRPVTVLVDAHVVRRPSPTLDMLTIIVGQVAGTSNHLAGAIRLHGDRVAALEDGNLVQLAEGQLLGSGRAADIGWFHELAIEALLRQLEIDNQVARYLADPEWQKEIANWSGVEPA